MDIDFRAVLGTVIIFSSLSLGNLVPQLLSSILNFAKIHTNSIAALQELQVIHVATHDSIGTGEDGPTHQPIELASLYRAMPNLFCIRPCDSEETAGAFKVALQASTTQASSQHPARIFHNTKRASVIQ